MQRHSTAILLSDEQSKNQVMKRIIGTIFLFTCLGAAAQEPLDALRYSWYVPGGSARVKAIGGTMGSLGGDITTTFVNPAGLAFYKTGDFIISPNHQFRTTKGTYLDKSTKDKGNKFAWGTTGFVIGSGAENKDLRNAAFSIAYNRTADFNSNITYGGTNFSSSYSQKFLEEIQRNDIRDGNQLANNYPYGSSLAFNTYWIDTVGGGTNGNFQFQSRSRNLLSSGLVQQNKVTSKGGIDEFAIGFAANYRDKWMFGGTIGVPYLHYKRESEFIEADATNNKNGFDNAIVEESLKTTGVGFNLKLGGIYKPSEFWRLGLAFHTPTYYSLKDVTETVITTDRDRPDSILSDYSIDYNDGNPGEFKYDLLSPYRAIGSISYVIREIQDVTKQRGFISADVEYVNYKASSFSPHEDENTQTDEGTKSYLKQLNRAIDNAYKGAFNFRLGGELKFTTVMVRLGAAYYGNPYKNINGEKGSKLNLSGGLGYRNKGFFVDATYVHAINKDVHYAYRLQNAPYPGAAIKNTTGQVYLTLGVKI